MVPTLRGGFMRSNFCFAICPPSSPCLRALRLGHDLARDRLRRILVAVELHRECGATLRRRTQIGRITEHRGKRDAGANRLRISPWLEPFDPAAARVEISHDIAEVLLRRHD